MCHGFPIWTEPYLRLLVLVLHDLYSWFFGAGARVKVLTFHYFCVYLFFPSSSLLLLLFLFLFSIFLFLPFNSKITLFFTTHYFSIFSFSLPYLLSFFLSFFLSLFFFFFFFVRYPYSRFLVPMANILCSSTRPFPSSSTSAMSSGGWQAGRRIRSFFFFFFFLSPCETFSILPIPSFND